MLEEVESGPMLGNAQLPEMSAVENRLPISASGSTCTAYKLFRDNRFYFQKLLRPELASEAYYRELFRKEFEVGQGLDSEYFPRYYSLQETDDEVSIVMEYVDGESLEQRLQSHPEYFADRQKLHRFLTQLLQALKVLHTRQLLHLDINPNNILLTTVNDDVRLIDLGYCHTDSAPFTEGRTPMYAAPEQLCGKGVLTVRTDIYAVGGVMKCIDERTALPRHYRKLMCRALSEDASSRFASVEDMLGEMNSTSHGYLYRTIGACAMFVVLAAVGALLWQRHKDTTGEVFLATLRDGEVLHLKVLSHDSLSAAVVAAEGARYCGELYIPPMVSYKSELYTITAVADSAFMGCDSLITLSLPSTIHNIGNDAFRNCYRLRYMTLPDSVQHLGRYTFAGDTALSSVIIPPSVRTLPRGCFVDCYHLSEVTLPVSLLRIEQDAFVSCHSLTELCLPDSVVQMGRGVFYNCSNLRAVTLPTSLTSLDVYAFMECPKLEYVECRSVTPPSAANVFDRRDIRLIVPPGAEKAYGNATGWKVLYGAQKNE